MLEAAQEALGLLFQAERIGWLGFGIGVGLVIGFIPGLSGAVGMSILLPFIFGMDSASGIAMLIGMAAVTHTSDTFPSVLLGVPGSAGSQATIMDGYPLARQGRAAYALGASFAASMAGGIAGALLLFVTIPIAAPLVLALGPPELLMFTLLGLSMVAILVKGSAVIGLTMAALGMLLGTVGAAPAAAEYRFSFDLPYLFDGLSLAIIALGLFAIPEMIDLAMSRKSISGATKMIGRQLEGVGAALKHWTVVLRGSVLGSLISILPGIGGAVIDWILYAITKQTVKDSSHFGKGDIRGVLGPESANSAKEGGSLIPTLFFGIPGSTTTAILLGGMVLMGLRPGPAMVEADLHITLLVVWTLAIASVTAALICLLVAPYVARMTLVSGSRLFIFLLPVLIFAAYQTAASWGDVLLLFAIGGFGWIMKRFAWPRPPLLIGFVLSTFTERYLHLSMSLHGWSWLAHPSVLAIGFTILALVLGRPAYGLVKARLHRKAKT